MPANYSTNIVYLSKAQYQELLTNQTITVNGTTVTYNENDIYVTPQAEPITDIKVNGTNLTANNGAVNIFNLDSIYGINKNSSGYLYVTGANEGYIKENRTYGEVINPSNQHYSVFYGLSRAAGVNLAGTDTTFGTYPDSSKAAIQNLLGITDLLSTEESSPATTAHTLNSTFMMNGKLHRATAAIAIGDAVEVGTNCEVVKADEVFVKKTDFASTSNAGVVKTWSNHGIYANEGRLAIDRANSTTVKQGTSAFFPVVPSHQHEATFYGLAKAAGDTTQSISTNAVGTYTSEAKAAIQSMLDVPSKADVANLIAVSTTAPSESEAKIWIDTDDSTTVQVPTVSEMNLALATKVGDVQVNGTSVVSDGVANIPIATSNGNLGLSRIDSGQGITITTNNNTLSISSASTELIKIGVNSKKPIVPEHQHEAVFYGLAKAAGDSTQSISTNAVGTYTDDAKLAIKDMLGITQTLTVTVLTQDNVTVTGQTVTVRAANATGHIFATAAYEGQPVAFAVPSGFAYYISVSDTLDHHFNPTTASGVITDTDVSVTLQYSDFSTIRTAADIKAALNAGLDLTDLVGEQITCTKNGETLTWDVVDYDATNRRIMLLLHDAFGTANMVFEPAQALMWCENGLAAGSYTFTWNTTQCYFTLTTAIPAGGQLRATNSQFQTYASQDATVTLETGTVGTDEITGATDLGHDGQGLLNHRDRVNYGSNNQAESAIQWWLNTDAPAGTLRTPVTKFSRAYSYNVPGFMNGLDSNFVSHLDNVDWLCSTNNVYECPESLGGYTKGTRQAYTINAKFCLASEMEIFGSYGGNPDGSTVFDLYNGAEADDRKKYRGTSAQTYWLRSPSWGNAYNERIVSSSGSAGNHYAYTSCAVVPACRISRDQEVTV